MEENKNLEGWERIGITNAYDFYHAQSGNVWPNPFEVSLYAKEILGKVTLKAVVNGHDYLVYERNGNPCESDSCTHYFTRKTSNGETINWLNLSNLKLLKDKK